MRSSPINRWRAPYCALLACVTLLSCVAEDQGPTEKRFLDLIVEKSLVAGGKAMQASEVVAGDETWMSITVGPNQRLAADLDLGSDPVLALRGTVRCGESFDGQPAGVLRGGVRARSKGLSSFTIELESGDGWWRREVAIGSGRVGPAQLWFETELPNPCSLVLNEATLERSFNAPQSATARPQQMLLISVDTLRNDAVGALGGSVATPSLDRFAAGAESWSHHYATASWTKPSHASMLTGFHPETHRAINLEQAMDPAVPTLAERLGTLGFKTAALVFDCTWLSPRWGFGKGFDSYRVTRWRAARQARMAAEWMLDHRDEQFFFFLHTFEPHSDFSILPYEAPDLTRGKIGEVFGVSGFGCREGRCASQFVNGLDRGEVAIEEGDAEILRYSYDEGVRYLDRALGELFDTLRTSDLWDNMLIVVTSDHGEAFGERGEFGHNSVHEEIVRVPLMVKWPGGEHAGVVRSDPRSAVDLAPTLLDFAGFDAGSMPGEDLRRPQTQRPIIAGTVAKAVIDGDHKAIFAGSLPVHLYDLGVDPGELDNIASARSSQVSELRKLLREHRLRSQAVYETFGPSAQAGEVVLSESERERLRAFGYLE
jgi:arylsulfatase A-like enzyme